MRNTKKLITTIMILIMILSLVPTNVSATTLKKPAKVNIKSITSTYNTISISWKKAKKISKVKQYQIKVDGVKTYTVKGKSKVSKTIDGLTAGTTYKIKIRAKNKKGYGKWSKTKKITTKSLNQVSNVKVSSEANSNKVTIQFDIVNGADKYVIKRASIDNPTFQNVGTVQGTQTPISYVDSNVKADTTYYYKVIPMVGSEETTTTSISYEITPSATDDVIGKEISDTNIPILQLPNVTNLIAKEKTGKYKSWDEYDYDKLATYKYKYMNLSWDKVEGADGYIIERYGNASNLWIKVKSTKKTSYAVPEIVNDTKTRIRVRAYKNLNGAIIYSDYSETIINSKKLYQPNGKIVLNDNYGTIRKNGFYRFYAEEAFLIQNKIRAEKMLNH